MEKQLKEIIRSVIREEFINEMSKNDVHVREISGTKEGNFNLKWVHIAISNLKKHLQTYHMISERMMQNYLDEFCYKLNRRYFGEKLFDRLIVAAIYPYWHDCG